MSKLQFPQRTEGHRFDNYQNNDLDQKLPYQQLLDLKNNLSKENMELKNITHRLGKELNSLHTQFQIKPRDENTELYQAIGSLPVLHQYESTLMPLLDAYESKIQEFQHGFETMHEEFFTLEKKFEDVCRENEELKGKLTDKIKQLLEVYKNGGSEKMHSDFGQIILEQVNERQKVLVEENAKLQRDYQRNKSEAERAKSELEATTEKLEQCKSKIRQYQISQRQLQAEVKSLKDSSFDLQIKANQLEAEKRKLDQAHERAQSQNNQLNKEKEIYKNRLEELRFRVQRDTSIPIENDQSKLIEQLETKIAFLEAEQGPTDYHKKLTKVQKDYDSLVKEKNRLKDALEGSKIREDELEESITDLRAKISGLEAEKSAYMLNESKIKKSLDSLTQKCKNDLVKAKRQSNDELEKVEFDLKHKIEMKEKRISDLEEALEKLKLEKEKLEREVAINSKDLKPKPTKQSERALAKMKEKMAINEDLFKEQVQIFENDLSYMKKELDAQRNECKQKNEELKKLRANYDQLKKQYEEVCIQKNTLIEEFRRVRNQYEGNLKDKERLFEQKIREIKSVVEESDNKRRSERERVQEATREYKRVLEDIKSAYEARIRELESQVTEVRYRTQIQTVTPH